jgi:hypothetical protein
VGLRSAPLLHGRGSPPNEWRSFFERQIAADVPILPWTMLVKPLIAMPTAPKSGHGSEQILCDQSSNKPVEVTAAARSKSGKPAAGLRKASESHGCSLCLLSCSVVQEFEWMVAEGQQWEHASMFPLASTGAMRVDATLCSDAGYSRHALGINGDRTCHIALRFYSPQNLRLRAAVRSLTMAKNEQGEFGRAARKKLLHGNRIFAGVKSGVRASAVCASPTAEDVQFHYAAAEVADPQ